MTNSTNAPTLEPTMNYPFTYKDRTFTIDTEEQTRVVAFENGKPVYGDYTQFNIRENGKLLSFVFDQEMIPQVIYEMVEFPKMDKAIHSRYD